MSDPATLNYGGYDQPRPFSRAAFVALIAGILCGPAGIALCWLVALSRLGGSAVLPGLVLVFWHIGICSFCITTFERLRHPAAQRGRCLALGGIIATICWAVAIVAFIVFVLNDLD